MSSGYRFIPEEMTWKEHDDRARAMGGHLASITSAEENEQVTRISDGKPVWVGGVRKGSGNGPGADHWYWSDGQHWTYTNWHPGEPNNMGGGENRVHLGLQAPGTWNDVGEGWRGSAVYEISATPPTNISASQNQHESIAKSSETDVESTKNAAMIAFVVGIGLLAPGLPLVIGGYGPAGEENLGMIIPGWIMIGVGLFSIFVSAIAGLSLKGKSTRTQHT